jgi:hypothetical protein
VHNNLLREITKSMVCCVVIEMLLQWLVVNEIHDHALSFSQPLLDLYIQ